MSSEISKNITFNQICVLFSAISDSQRPRKKEILSLFLEKWRGDNPNEANSFFPVMRLLLPQMDRERGAYGIKERALAEIYIRNLGLPKNGSDAQKLLNYRAPKTAGSSAGDFADVAYWILKTRCDGGANLSLDSFNTVLDNIAIKHANHDPRGVDAELLSLIQSTTAEEQKWIIRIILKELKLGLGQSVIFETFHPDAQDLFNSTSSLSEVCEKLKDPNKRLNEIEVKMFSAFRPMLSELLDISNLESHFNKSCSYVVECKMDGERFQVHMEDGKYKYFSRRAHDYTSNYGADVSGGMLTPHLAKQLAPHVKSIILDGEMMCWHTRNKCFTTKGMEIDVKKLNNSHVHRPCFCPFDILYLNGQNLANTPLVKRLEMLEQVVVPLEGVVSLVPRKRVGRKEEVIEALNQAINDCEEGIILKDFLSVYKPNGREKAGWFKIKPEYTDGLMDTVDLLIIGGYHGEGRYKGGISHFLLAVSHEGEFWSAGKVGCGYSMAELGKLQSQLEPFWQPVRKDVLPDKLKWTKEKPDMWIAPENSIVLEIKASEIVPSDLYKTNYTLRFARVENIRHDKGWNDCVTLDDFNQKRMSASGKLTAHKFTENELSPPKVKRARTQLEVAEQFKAADTSNVQVVSELLKGKELCVFSGYQNLKKEDVEKKIVRYGGKIVQNPGLNTWCVLAEEKNFRISNLAESGRHDVIRCSWLLPLLTREAQPTSLPPVPRHGYLCCSLRTAAKLSRDSDEFGDHYTLLADEQSLRCCMNEAARAGVPTITEEEKAELDEELFAGVNPFFIFRRLVTFSLLQGCDDVTLSNLDDDSLFSLRSAIFLFTFNGGREAEALDETVTHVICPSDSECIEQLKRIRQEMDRKFHLVPAEWVKSCLEKKIILNERDFPL